MPRWLLALIAIALGGGVVPAYAERVMTVEGGIYQVDTYQVDGDWARLELSGSGVMLLPLSKIDRVVDDALMPRAGTQILSEPFDLRFDADSDAPDTPFGKLIFETARRHGVSARLIAAIIRAESAFDPKAISHKGARGLMQLMPGTAERFGVSADRLFEPAENLEAGVRYLKFLTTRFPNDLARILAAYNAGESQVDRYGGVPPFRETQVYVRKIARFLRISGLKSR